jgi:putative cell wall-binding protein
VLVLTATIAPATAVVVPGPANDAFATATTADPLPFYETLDTSMATTETVDAEAAGLCGLGAAEATVWYTFTAGESRSFQVDVTNSTYDAGVVVVTGDPGSLALTACRAGSVGFEAEAGIDYRVLVYGSSPGGGSLHVAIGFGPPWDYDRTQEQVNDAFCIQPNQDSACYNGAAQTVTAGLTGRLQVIALPLARASFTTKDLVVEIRAGGPSGSLLATSDPVPAADIPVGEIDGAPTTMEWIPFWFTAPPTIEAGQVYAMVIPPVPLYPTSDPAWGWGKASSNVYGGGTAYGGSGLGGTASWSPYVNGSDFAFDTIVEPLGWPRVVRYWDSNRFGTAVDISYNTFYPGVDVAYVANAYNFPDALAGAAAAGTVKGPVLLAAKNLPLDPSTAAELQGLHPKKIVVLGGTGVISDAVLNALKSYTTGSVVRYSGLSRFETAASISANTFVSGAEVAYIAYAYNFPDALAGAAAAGAVKGPVLLAATTGTLNPATAAELTRLKPKSIIVLGGTGVISDAVLNALKAYTSGSVTRYSGASRFATAAAISAHTFDPGVDVAYVAYAYNFPDALAGAAAAGTVQGPVLLTAKNLPLDPSTTAELTRLQPKRIVVLGGTGVISDAVLSALKTYATGP